MLFQSYPFLVFFVAVMLLLAALKRRIPQMAMLLAASYVFYMCWNVKLIVPILFSTVWDFVSAQKMFASNNPRTKKRWLLASLTVDLGMLAWFKYYNFFIDSVNGALGAAGFAHSLPLLNIMLPVGISFYTFEAVSYSVDVYMGKCEPCRNLLDFALYLAYFPHLVAGPIMRPWDFIPQIQRAIRLRAGHLRAGAHLFLTGLFKKVVLADNLAPFSDGVLGQPQGQPSLVIVLGTLAFGLRIFCDFSGYTDMGRGLARMMGIELPLNFNRPYLAHSIADFWRRWHISLSTWLRDYLYIPLGGNRKGSGRTYVNLMLTMLIGGLWHGAAWHFVLWGAYQGLLLSIERFLASMVGSQSWFLRFAAHPAGRVAQWALTQYLVFLGWILFFVSRPSDILYCVRKYVFFDQVLSLGGAGLGALRPLTVVTLILIFILLEGMSGSFGHFDEKLNRLRTTWRFPAYVMLGAVMILLWPAGEVPFVYFQF